MQIASTKRRPLGSAAQMYVSSRISLRAEAMASSIAGYACAPPKSRTTRWPGTIRCGVRASASSWIASAVCTRATSSISGEGSVAAAAGGLATVAVPCLMMFVLSARSECALGTEPGIDVDARLAGRDAELPQRENEAGVAEGQAAGA